jgi:hypothetical protein
MPPILPIPGPARHRKPALTMLEGDYLFCKALSSFIRPAADAGLDLGSAVELTHLRTERTFAGNSTLALDAAEKAKYIRDRWPG